MRLRLSVLIALLFVLASPALQASTGTHAPAVAVQYFDANGDPCNGCQLFTYEAGTSTKASTYTEVTLTTANANPIVLDSAGRCTIFLTPGSSYKFVLAPPTDTDPPAAAYWTRDNVSAVPPVGTATNTEVSGTAGENLAEGDAVYLSKGDGGQTAGRWYKMDASDPYTNFSAGAVGFATTAITSAATGTIRIGGRMTGLSGLTAGTLYYPAESPAGSLSSSATGSGARVLLMADSTTTGVINASPNPIWGMQFSRVTSSPTYNATTTLADVSGLAFAIGASETWAFSAPVYVSSSTAADMKFAITVPAGATLVLVTHGSITPTAAQRTTTSGAGIPCLTSSFAEVCHLTGLVINSTTAGTVQVQAAQNTSDATNSSIAVNSHILAWRVP